MLSIKRFLMVCLTMLAVGIFGCGAVNDGGGLVEDSSETAAAVGAVPGAGLVINGIEHRMTVGGEFGSYQPWIEFFNGGSQTLTLNGYRIYSFDSGPAQKQLGSYDLRPISSDVYWQDDLVPGTMALMYTPWDFSPLWEGEPALVRENMLGRVKFTQNPMTFVLTNNLGDVLDVVNIGGCVTNANLYAFGKIVNTCSLAPTLPIDDPAQDCFAWERAVDGVDTDSNDDWVRHLGTPGHLNGYVYQNPMPAFICAP